ncbi:MAG: hypothetical protein L7F77_12370 [Candidatus Magnetominusculus sp. LBB02]|nr:hypothetical protein [Candidatus Magnetominusculus sp. LBB02]
MSKWKVSVRVSALFVLAAVLIMTGVVWAGTANFTMPFLSTSNSTPTYCVVSNFNKGDNSTNDNSSDTTVTFKVMATDKGGSSQTAYSIPAQYTPKSGYVRVLSFIKTGIYTDNGQLAVDLSGDLGTTSSGSNKASKPTLMYTGSLAVTSTTATCKTISMSCVQGSSEGNGKRTIIGYTCDDGTNLLSY